MCAAEGECMFILSSLPLRQSDLYLSTNQRIKGTTHGSDCCAPSLPGQWNNGWPQENLSYTDTKRRNIRWSFQILYPNKADNDRHKICNGSLIYYFQTKLTTRDKQNKISNGSFGYYFLTKLTTKQTQNKQNIKRVFRQILTKLKTRRDTEQAKCQMVPSDIVSEPSWQQDANQEKKESLKTNTVRSDPYSITKLRNLKILKEQSHDETLNHFTGIIYLLLAGTKKRTRHPMNKEKLERWRWYSCDGVLRCVGLCNVMCWVAVFQLVEWCWDEMMCCILLSCIVLCCNVLNCNVFYWYMLYYVLYFRVALLCVELSCVV